MNNIFFETIKCEDYECFHLEYHKKRIARTIGVNINLEEYIYPPTSELLKCKVIYDQNGILDICYNKYNKRKINSFKIIHSDTINYEKKYLQRDLLNQLYKKRDFYDEIIIIKNGFITDTSFANIAIFYENQWITPKIPLLHGTTSSRYIEMGFLREENITINMLQKGTKIGLLNAMIDFDIIENFKIK